MSPKLARRLIEPDYLASPQGNRRPDPIMTYGPEVADVCARADFAPDPQQELLLDLTFAIRPDGSPQSFAGCVICCRQNLKTGFFKQAVLGWIYVTEEPTVVWSSHEMSTTNDAERDLDQLICGRSFLSRQLAPGRNDGIFYGNSDQRIEFRTGQQILFKARTHTGSRGLARRKLILDEAFALQPAMMGSLVPTMLAQPNAQMLYGSSAGKADSAVLQDVRDRGRLGMSPRLWYAEWLAPRESCADPNCRHPKDAKDRGIDCALDREHLRVKANPALSTGRITLERIEDMRQELPPEEFARECLGWWDESTVGAVFPASVWAGLRSTDPPPQDVPPDALGVDASHDRVIAIAGCWISETESGAVPYVELVALDRAADPLAAVDWIADRAGGSGSRRIPVVIDGASPAAAMVSALTARRVQVKVTNAADMGKAAGLFSDEFQAGRLTHAGQPQLDQAVQGARKRRIGDAGAFGWDRRDAGTNIAPLVAATLARYGASTHAKPRTGRAVFA